MQCPLCELTILARLKLTVFFNKTSFELLGILKTDIIFFHPISLKTISYQIINILQSSNVRKIFGWASLLALINTTSTMSWLFLIQVLFQGDMRTLLSPCNPCTTMMIWALNHFHLPYGQKKIPTL